MPRLPLTVLVSVLVLLAGCSGDDPAPSMEEPAAQVVPMEALAAFQDSGTFVAGTGPSSTPLTPACNNLEEEGVDVNRHAWDIVGDVNGSAAEVVHIEVTMTIVDDTLLDADMYLESPSGEVLGEAVAFNAMTGPTETIAVDGGLDAGTYTVVVRACTGSGGYELEGEALLRQVVEDDGAVTATATSGSASMTPGPAA